MYVTCYIIVMQDELPGAIAAITVMGVINNFLIWFKTRYAEETYFKYYEQGQKPMAGEVMGMLLVLFCQVYVMYLLNLLLNICIVPCVAIAISLG